MLASPAPATAVPQDTQADEVIGDPFEGINRQIFKANNFFDRIFFKPLAQAYDFILPDSLQASIGNALRNLGSPLNFANQLLQGDFKGAGKTLGRFVVNSTLGVGGLVDFADAELNWEHENEDLGQTLAVWGVPSGPYLILPFFGPSTVRDAFGLGVESFGDPLDIWLRNNDELVFRTSRTGVAALDGRASALGLLEELRDGSLDFYSALRSSFTQRRESLIRDGERMELEFPDFDQEGFYQPASGEAD